MTPPALLHDSFGPCLCSTPPHLAASVLRWKNGAMKRLAEEAYKERVMPAGTLDTGRLAVLADALEEAGCTNTELLDHLRGPGPHVRGCFVLDCLLGRN